MLFRYEEGCMGPVTVSFFLAQPPFVGTHSEVEG